jgi:hypothetical protein
MDVPSVRADESVFDRIRDAILNRGDGDEDRDPSGPGRPA